MPLLMNGEAFRGEKPLDIPKELWMMVDHLYRNASQQVGSLCATDVPSLPMGT